VGWRKGFLLDRKRHLLYRSSIASANGSGSKQVCVVNAQPERKLRKELCGRVLQAAQLSAQEKDAGIFIKRACEF